MPPATGKRRGRSWDPHGDGDGDVLDEHGHSGQGPSSDSDSDSEAGGHGDQAEAKGSAGAEDDAEDDDLTESERPDSDRGSEAGGQGDQAQATAPVQPGKELGAKPAQGGGAKDALRAMIQQEEQGAFSYDVFEDDLGNVQKVVYHPSPGEDVVFERPNKEEDDDWVLWRLMEKGRLAMKVNAEMVRDLRAVSGLVEPYRDEPPPPVMVNMKTGKIVARANGDRRDHTMPERIHWKLKNLPKALHGKIEGKYFLQIGETVKDVHGNLYCPKDQDTGSMCATTGFPHAIAYTKEKGRGKTQASLEYIVSACNKVRLAVRLMKWESPGVAVQAYESEILRMIASQRSAGQMQCNIDYEQDMMLYVALEFADGDDNFARVPTSCFVQEPLLGALFTPAESPPYKCGHYEWPMHNGVGIIDFRIAKGVTTSALKKAHKGRQFRFVVKALNPFLSGLDGFTARTRGFCLKGVLHNDAKSSERYVKTKEGAVVASPESDFPEKIEKRKKKKKK